MEERGAYAVACQSGINGSWKGKYDMTDIIDFHTHPYRNETQNMCMYKESFSLDFDAAVNDLKGSGITHICGSVIDSVPYDVSAGFSYIKRLNEQAAAIHEQYKEFYTPGFHIHPAFVKESLEETERMHRKGMRLIGELVPYQHGWRELGFDYGSPALREILSLAGEYEMVVSFHNMKDWQEETDKMVRENPKVLFVAAHPGLKADFLRHLERMKAYGNLYLDLSGTGLFRYGMLRHGVKEVGADRFLFGTDYPISNPRMYVQAVFGEHISDDDRRKIFAENARRILGFGNKK